MKFPKHKFRTSRKKARLRRRRVTFAGVVLVLLCATIGMVLSFPETPTRSLTDNGTSGIAAEYAALLREVQDLEATQSQAGVEVAASQEIEQLVGRVRTSIDLRQAAQARTDMKTARATLAGWRNAIGVQTATMFGQETGQPRAGTVFMPILFYHYTPPNFDEQLSHLERTGYTVISLDQAVAGLAGGPLPAKPVVITFDDGFANQMQAFAILQQHRMKATFYIVNGGETSLWCIGSSRRYNDPLQPLGGCGDDYLTWDQVRMLDRSGLITIAAHTLDHENLVGLDADGQRRQIVESKLGIEREIGHPIKHLAYPYGAYNQMSIDIAREAGYLSATTTEPGFYQQPGTQFVLKRERDALVLP